MEHLRCFGCGAFRQHLNLGRFIEHWWAETPIERARLAALMVRLCETARRLGIEPHLRLSPDECAFWQGLRNGHEAEDLPQRFEDLIQYISSQRGKTSSSTGTSSASKRGRRSHSRADENSTKQNSPLRSGQQVRHPAYGVGTVIRVYKSGEHELAHIRFLGGSKHISVKYGMLQLA